MGMFDDIRYEAPCPICGTPLTGWQSKSGGCGLQKLTPAELVKDARGELDVPLKGTMPVNFYQSCQECKTWVTVQIEAH